MTRPEYSEVQLCAEFAEWIGAYDFLVYPETGGWDLLLVATSDTTLGEHGPFLKAGDQVGVQAKLVGNYKVLYQALDPQGPGWRAVLVGRAPKGFHLVTSHLGLLGFVREHRRGKTAVRYNEGFKTVGHIREHASNTRVGLPPVVPDLPAGGKSPRQLTEWRLKALKMVKKLRSGVVITNQDFKDLALFKPRWIRNGWVDVTRSVGFPDSYTPGPAMVELLRGYEVVYDQLEKAGEL